MKRNIFLFSLIAASMFLLVACGDITGMKNPGQAVLKMYQAAVENDQETLNELLTYFREYDGDQMEVTEELKD